MAVIVHVLIPGLTKEQYDQVRAKVGWLDKVPDGGLAHLTYWDGADCHNWDAWESEAAFGAFGQDRLGPAMAELGIDAAVEPAFYPAHEVYLPNKLTTTATPA